MTDYRQVAIIALAAVLKTIEKLVIPENATKSTP
jgi:hypothetical protein